MSEKDVDGKESERTQSAEDLRRIFSEALDGLLRILTSDADESDRLKALTSFLERGDGLGVVAIGVYGMSKDDILKVFSSKDIDIEWKRRRLTVQNCGDCMHYRKGLGGTCA